MELIYLIIPVLFIIICYNLQFQKTHTIFGKVASNSNDLKIGLMFRKKKLKLNEGMLFPFINSVWMKNTYIPLDVIFLNDNMEVVDYYQNTTPLSTRSISTLKNNAHILEMNAGSVDKLNINRNDIITFIKMN